MTTNKATGLVSEAMISRALFFCPHDLPTPAKHRWMAEMISQDVQAVLGVGAWRPIAEAPRDGTYVLITDRRHPPCYLIAKWRHGKWWSAPTKSGHSITWDEATDFMPLPTPPQDDQP